MTGNTSDAAPDKGGQEKAASGNSASEKSAGQAPISAARVAEYLRRHPDFLARNPALLETIEVPGRDQGDGVVDLQRFMVERLRSDLSELTATRDDLVVNVRNNMATQSRTHEAIIALLAARSFEHFVETVTTDLAIILDLDVVALAVEQSDQDGPGQPPAGVRCLQPGTVNEALGPTQNILLRSDIDGDPLIFGAGAGLVRSDALIRLDISSEAPPALLALGSRQSDQFDPGQGTELLRFLAQVIEHTFRAWLSLPE
ncbi:DUF484 family protein [Pelagibius sp. Alg239-R121]|uniref:DUF484 family protein n=1 Tax=Pelagibius sp. Alg239-R121 TaxID=2993448 RepID=UPI0024A6D30F|nr:DUF484 family protein [Pelagibius sp. Alg239-R121]